MARRIGLVGPFVSRNLGDTAIQMAVIRAIRERLPQSEIVGICTEPDDTRRTHGIDAFPFTWEVDDAGKEPFARWPWRVRGLLQRLWHIPRVLRLAGGLDLLVISGGGQLDEFWGGPYRQPYLLWVWTLAARLRGVPAAAFAVGWDYLDSRAGRRFCVAAMKRVGYRYLRDEGTLRELRSAGVDGDASVGPDAAFGLWAPDVAATAPKADPRRFVVVSPIAVNAVPPQYRARHAEHLDQLGNACMEWMQQGFDIKFVCSQPVMDGPWISELTRALEGASSGARWTISRETTVTSYLQEVRGATFVVAARLHGLILALVAGSPVIGLNYSRKIGQLLSDFDLQPLLVDPETATASDLRSCGALVLANEVELRGRVSGRVMAAQDRLRSAYDSLLELLAH